MATKPLEFNTPDSLIKILIRARVCSLTSLREFSRTSGYHYSTLQGWESRTRTPDLKTFIDWANTLDYDVVLVRRITYGE